MVKMWNPTAETMSRDEYAKVQLEGLKKSLARVWGNEFYRARLQAGGGPGCFLPGNFQFAGKTRKYVWS